MHKRQIKTKHVKCTINHKATRAHQGFGRNLVTPYPAPRTKKLADELDKIQALTQAAKSFPNIHKKH